MNIQKGEDEKKNGVDYFSSGAENARRNSIFGSYSEAEMLAQLKGLALDPCSPRSNIQPLCNQILRIRKVMMLEDSEIPWRKRKLEQFVKDKLKSPPAFALPNQQNVTKLSRGLLSHASSVSCLLNSVDSTQCPDRKNKSNSRTSSSLMTFEGVLPDIPVSTECSFLEVVLSCPFDDTSPTVDTDGSVNGSNPLSPVSPTPNDSPSLEINDAVQYLGTATMDGKRRKQQMTPSRRSVRLLNFIGDHIQRKVIPVGPRFQADVPEWSGGPVDRSSIIGAYKGDFGNSKWLGFTVWPIEVGSRTKTTGMRIGKGRPNSCCCKSSGSADCVRRHIHEKRLILRSELGPAFFTWKFDEMGEQVSNSWSLKEQKTFDSLLKKKSSKEKNFLKRALKSFRNKSGSDIVNYYFNVYIPLRMSVQTRSPSIEQIDTDDEDETEDFNYMGVQKKSEGRSPTTCNSMAVKDRYLHRGSK